MLVFSVYIPFLISRVRPVHSIFEKKSILENPSQIFTNLFFHAYLSPLRNFDYLVWRNVVKNLGGIPSVPKCKYSQCQRAEQNFVRIIFPVRGMSKLCVPLQPHHGLSGCRHRGREPCSGVPDSEGEILPELCRTS